MRAGPRGWRSISSIACAPRIPMASSATICPSIRSSTAGATRLIPPIGCRCGVARPMAIPVRRCFCRWSISASTRPAAGMGAVGRDHLSQPQYSRTPALRRRTAEFAADRWRTAGSVGPFLDAADGDPAARFRGRRTLAAALSSQSQSSLSGRCPGWRGGIEGDSIALRLPRFGRDAGDHSGHHTGFAPNDPPPAYLVAASAPSVVASISAWNSTRRGLPVPAFIFWPACWSVSSAFTVRSTRSPALSASVKGRPGLLRKWSPRAGDTVLI